MKDKDYIVLRGSVEIPIPAKYIKPYEKEISKLVEEAFSKLCQQVLALITQGEDVSTDSRN
jgi:hypothetical protein